jgi:beta-lactam-binding protein with PASTA domain
MSNIGNFIKSRLFLLNLLLAIALLILFFWGAVKFLDKYTRHGQYIVLPNLNKVPLANAEAKLNGLGLKYLIIDSVYDETLPPGCITNQNPYPGAHVKSGRNVYLYLSSRNPPLVEMPNLIDKSLREAEIMLQNVGLKTGTVVSRPDPLPGVILEQRYKNAPITPGAQLPKGSAINLIVAGNVSDTVK